jgi:hypothetical protein
MKNAEWQLADSYPISWNNPRFDTPFERRRLRILNSLFFAVAKMKGKPSVSGREELEIPIYFFQQQFHFTLDQPKQLPRCGLLSELEAEERKRKLDAERAEKERQKRIEQARINRLLSNALCPIGFDPTIFDFLGACDDLRKPLAHDGRHYSIALCPHRF